MSPNLRCHQRNTSSAPCTSTVRCLLYSASSLDPGRVETCIGQQEEEEVRMSFRSSSNAKFASKLSVMLPTVCWTNTVSLSTMSSSSHLISQDISLSSDLCEGLQRSRASLPGPRRAPGFFGFDTCALDFERVQQDSTAAIISIHAKQVLPGQQHLCVQPSSETHILRVPHL